MSVPAIETSGLTKSFGDTAVLTGLDLTVPTGSVYALLGPNGTGKTTTVHILSTLLAPDSGVAHVAGHDVRRHADAVRSVIGVTGQFSAVDNLLTGEENLRIMADLRHLGRLKGSRVATDLLEKFELTEAAGKPASTYSGGMRRRLDLAMTLVSRPQIIYLDEPTTGLDPRSRRTMRQIVKDLVAEGVTVLLTTQYLDEADELADRVGVLNEGTIVAEGTPRDLKSRIDGGRVVLTFDDADALACAGGGLADSIPDPEKLSLSVPSDGGVASVRSVLARLDALEVEPTSLSIRTPSLDDVFFALTGNSSPTPTTTSATEVEL
ncbi:ATP-binding cassette domain-containing protein [Microbacterium sp. MPKO10]|uniref:ATP-binding cassette domain-containing protein n=1 Tax=Microbacterium sp. MPKO10 TaxID=2989818 RepID=UPI0022356FF7|nr:ATP-binding cassette domain-containing protein [Microbacterium sp. MPKO10]MCW4456985.1 ATP-binding cassette domain-containing protein [Microbacterium sp. MPKO10]